MIDRPHNQTFIAKYPLKNRRIQNRYRPFWLPASNFYILAAALAVAVFFIAWAFLNVSEDELPLVSAGLLASMILAGAVVLREIILRSARYRLLMAQERLEQNIKTVRMQNSAAVKSDKLTVERNKEILGEIERKSKSASNYEKLPENHWRVFELCHEYLQRSERELEVIGYGSPRIHILRQSREKVENLHKYHLLMWSSLESRALIKDAKISSTVSKKLENANKALAVLDSAIEFYPGEQELLDSVAAVKDFAAKVKVSHWIELAERAAFKKNYKRAIDHYRDALFYLARENAQSEEKEIIAAKINGEIEKIRNLSGN